VDTETIVPRPQLKLGAASIVDASKVALAKSNTSRSSQYEDLASRVQALTVGQAVIVQPELTDDLTIETARRRLAAGLSRYKHPDSEVRTRVRITENGKQLAVIAYPNVSEEPAS